MWMIERSGLSSCSLRRADRTACHWDKIYIDPRPVPKPLNCSNLRALSSANCILYQPAKTLTHAACALPRHPLAETYGDTMGYRRPPRAQTVAPMSQGLRVLVLNKGIADGPGLGSNLVGGQFLNGLLR